MPQGKRRTPFSGKAKKEQLKNKKQNKNQSITQRGFKNAVLLNNSDDEGSSSGTIQKLNYQQTKHNKARSNRYALEFYRETEAEIKQRKELARQTLNNASEKDFEINIDNYFVSTFDFPKRPPWSYKETPENLDAKEHHYFTEYINNITKNCDRKELSYFEMNLETWRQLWRVLEMSDIVLIIVDIRYPALMFPPSLYEYVTQTLNKDMILILNKVDLAPSEVVVAWKIYFKDRYPKLHIVMFTTFPGYNLIGNQSDKAGLQVRRRRGKLRMATEGTQQLFDACKNIVGNAVDLSTWQEKIKEEMSQEHEDDDALKIQTTIDLKKVHTGYFEHEKYKNGILTIGCVGQPNVGKSSLMNAIMGKKVVSVSKTPGHTKHFQTIFITSNVRLCDCPGLVFPSKVRKELQVLMGSFPVAQLREPFTTIKYLGEHLNLPKLLRIDHPDGDDEWSAMDICDGWAKKRGYLTAKAARLDSFRAANSLLRMAIEGKICLCLYPPDFFKKIEYWKNHPDNETVQWIQAKCSDKNCTDTNIYEETADTSDEELPKSSTANFPSTHSSADETDENSESNNEKQMFSTPNKFAMLGSN